MENLKERLKEQYAPFARKFVEQIGVNNVTGIPAPHIPIMGKNYESAQFRIAFVGMETYGWTDINVFCQSVKEDSHNAVIQDEDTINSLEYLNWANNYNTTFWGFVLKFLAKFYHVDFRELVKEKNYPEILTSFVWGNSNAIERFGVSAEPNGVDYNTWELVKKASICFDSINNLIKSVAPKLIFVLNRNVDGDYITNDDFVREMGVAVEKRKSVMTLDVDKEMKIRYHFLREDNVHIIALPHPTWMGLYSSYTIDLYVDKVIDIINCYHIWDKTPLGPQDWKGTMPDYCKSSIHYKRQFIADLAATLMKNNLVMSGKELQLVFNMNQIHTQSGYDYSTNGGRGIHRLITNVWDYYYNTKKDYQTAYNISRAFVNQNGEYAWG